MRSLPAMYSSASWLTIGFKPCFSRKPSDGSLLPAAKLSVLLGSLGGPDATILIGVVFLSFFVNLISFRHECCYMVGEQSNHLQNFEDSQTLRILYQPVRIAMSCSFSESSGAQMFADKHGEYLISVVCGQYLSKNIRHSMASNDFEIVVWTHDVCVSIFFQRLQLNIM